MRYVSPFVRGLSLTLLLLTKDTLASSESISPELYDSTEPVPISVTPSFVSNVPANTHTSTVGPDSKPTLVPIVGGSECWFCPDHGKTNHTEGGWALLGIEGPGTYLPSSSDPLDPIPIITVSSNGDPTYSPSRTKRDPPTEVKRDDLPTTTRMAYGARLSVLQQTNPKLSVVVGRQYGIRQKVYTEWNGIPVPKHYWLIAGNITKTIDEGPVYNCDNQIIKHEVVWAYDFEATTYDVEAPPHMRPRRISFRGSQPGDPEWYSREGAFYKYLGRMKRTVTDEEIRQRGRELAAQMDEEGYSTLFNNCGHFVKRLWEQVQLKKR